MRYAVVTRVKYASLPRNCWTCYPPHYSNEWAEFWSEPKPVKLLVDKLNRIHWLRIEGHLCGDKFDSYNSSHHHYMVVVKETFISFGTSLKNKSCIVQLPQKPSKKVGKWWQISFTHSVLISAFEIRQVLGSNTRKSKLGPAAFQSYGSVGPPKILLKHIAWSQHRDVNRFSVVPLEYLGRKIIF